MSTAADQVFTTIENVDRRILGAFVCVDAITGLSVTAPIQVTAPGWKIKPNRSGIYVIFDGPGLTALTTQFIPGSTWPASPPPFEVTLQDSGRRYLARRANILAPQSVPLIAPAPPGVNPNPAVAAALGNTAAVFDPQRVTLYPLPSAPVGPNWCTIHASVMKQGTTPPVGLPWAVLQVIRQSDNTVLAAGQTNSNGEALLAVVGLTSQPSTSTSGPVTVSTVAATLKAYFDPSVLSQPAGWVSNPDDILGNLTNAKLQSASQTVQLSPGLEVSLGLTVTG